MKQLKLAGRLRINPFVRIIDAFKKHPFVVVLVSVTAAIAWIGKVYDLGESGLRKWNEWFPRTEKVCSTSDRVLFVGKGDKVAYDKVESLNLVVVVDGGILELKKGGGLIANRINIKPGGRIEGDDLKIVAGNVEGGGTIISPNGGIIEMVVNSITGVSVVADGKKGNKGKDGSLSMSRSGIALTPRITPPENGGPGGPGGTIHVTLQKESASFQANGGEGGDGGKVPIGNPKTAPAGKPGTAGKIEKFKVNDVSRLFQKDDVIQTLHRARILEIESGGKGTVPSGG